MNTMEGQITKLKGENWNICKFQILVAAEAKTFFDVMTGEVNMPNEEGKSKDIWKGKNSKAKDLIVFRMEEETVVNILNCKTAAEMWNKLLSIYEQESET